MDRTIIAPWKAEEKEQSERLYRKMQGLALVHPMTDEMKKLLVWDMFLKPNHAAFFHVMHYLFRLLDPAEFKRRFFWPLTDKKSEANFRSCTVEYLKHLNEKHQLQWTNIKSYLVVMPGGMRFINFLLEFVGFVIRELIKQREKSLADSDVQNADVKVMARQNAVMKDYASDYVANLEENMALLKHNTQKIRQTIEAFAKDAGIPEELLLDENFLEEFEASNRRTLERKVSQPAAMDVRLEESLCHLKEDLEKFQAKQSEHNQRKEAVNNVLNGFRGILGSETFTEEGELLPSTDKLLSDLPVPDFDDPLVGSKIEAMVKAFNQVSGTVAEQLDANDHYNESNEFVTTDLQALRVEVTQIESQLTNVQKDLNAQLHQIRERKEAEETAKRIGSSGSAQLQPPTTPRLESRFQDIASKFVSTPPIRIDLAGATGSSAPVRLALQDDYNSKQFDAFSNSLLGNSPKYSETYI